MSAGSSNTSWDPMFSRSVRFAEGHQDSRVEKTRIDFVYVFRSIFYSVMISISRPKSSGIVYMYM